MIKRDRKPRRPLFHRWQPDPPADDEETQELVPVSAVENAADTLVFTEAERDEIRAQAMRQRYMQGGF